MEHGDVKIPACKERPLWTLSGDALELIAHYAQANGVLKLIFTGDRVLAHKLRLSRSLCIEWQKPSQCDWSRCTAYLNSFPRLESLTMTAFSGHVLFIDMSIFAPTLQTLNLHFPGSVELSANPLFGTSLSSLPNLTNLSLSSSKWASNARYFPTQELWANLPRGLRKFSLKAPITKNKFYLHELVALPPDLDALQIHWSTNTPQVPIVLYFGTEHLPVKPKQIRITGIHGPVSIDIRNIGAALTVLVIDAPLLKPTDSRESYDPTDLRTLAPNLNTLKLLDRTVPLAWSAFEKLPLSLTNFHASFVPFDANWGRELAQLNAEYLRVITSDPSRAPGAPTMLRKFGTPTTLPASAFELFPNVSKFDCPNQVLQLGSNDVVRSLEANEIFVQNLPSIKSLSRLTCNVLTFDDTDALKEDTDTGAASSKINRAINSFWPLVSLQVPETLLTYRLIDMLPDTLEELDVKIGFHYIANSFVSQSARLRLLTDLCYRMTKVREGADRRNIELSLDSIPRTVKKLKIFGPFDFALGPSTQLLNRNTTLETLKIKEQAFDPDLLLSLILPKQLTCVSAHFATPIDLNTQIKLLKMFPPKLRYLKVKGLAWSDATLNSWFVPLEKDSFHQARSIVDEPEILNRLKLLLWVPCPNMARYFISEQIAYICLPRTLETFCAPTCNYTSWSNQINTQTPWYSKPSAHYAWEMFAHTILQNWGVRIPFLGFLMNMPDRSVLSSTATTEVHYRRLKFLPKTLSRFNTVDPRALYMHAFNEEERRSVSPAQVETAREQRSLGWITYHFINLATFCAVSYLFPPDRTHSLPWYIWSVSNLVGSSLALPIHASIWVFSRRRRLQFENSKVGSTDPKASRIVILERDRLSKKNYQAPHYISIGILSILLPLVTLAYAYIAGANRSPGRLIFRIAALLPVLWLAEPTMRLFIEGCPWMGKIFPQVTQLEKRSLEALRTF